VKAYARLIISPLIFFRMKNASGKICRENRNTHLMSKKVSSPRLCHLRDNVERYCKPTDNVIRRMRFACPLSKARMQAHAFIMCGTYCFSSAIVVTRTRLIPILLLLLLSSNMCSASDLKSLNSASSVLLLCYIM
jgi:hypothetical protein